MYVVCLRLRGAPDDYNKARISGGEAWVVESNRQNCRTVSLLGVSDDAKLEMDVNVSAPDDAPDKLR